MREISQVKIDNDGDIVFELDDTQWYISKETLESAKQKAAQPGVQPTGGEVPPLVEFLANPENYPSTEVNRVPPTSG